MPQLAEAKSRNGWWKSWQTAGTFFKGRGREKWNNFDDSSNCVIEFTQFDRQWRHYETGSRAVDWRMEEKTTMISSTSNPSQIATLAIASAAVSLYGCGSVTNDFKAMVQQQAAFAKEQMTDDESTSRMSPEQFMPNANEQPQPAQACRNMDPASAPHTAGAPRAATIACGSQAGEVNSAYATIAASTQSLGSHREFLPIHPDSCSTAIPTEVMSTGN